MFAIADSKSELPVLTMSTSDNKKQKITEKKTSSKGDSRDHNCDDDDNSDNDSEMHGGQGKGSLGQPSELVALAMKLATGATGSGVQEGDLDDDVAIALAALEASNGDEIDEAQDHFEDWRTEDNEDVCADLFDKQDHEKVSALEACINQKLISR